MTPTTTQNHAPRLDAARCPHFGECGGCLHQDIDYQEQLRAKQAYLEALFAPFWPQPIRVTPSPEIWHYRNKVDFTFAPKHYPEPPPKGFARETVLGFKRRGQWFNPLEIETCLIGPRENDVLLRIAKEWINDEGLRAYDSRTREGTLKTLVLRQGRRTGERMVMIVTARENIDFSNLELRLADAFPVHSLFHGLHDGTADGAVPDEVVHLSGAKSITEELHIPDEDGERRLRFRISPLSFFQTNSLATEQLYALVRAHVRASAPRILYDLYGGSGGFALTCSDLVDEAVSVDIVADAVEDGRVNAALNAAANVSFHVAKAKNFLLTRLQEGGMGDESFCILDPARSGMTPKAVRRTIECDPAAVVYVSCNPKIFVRELPQFLERYRLESLQAVDLFPHTDHVETVALLRR